MLFEVVPGMGRNLLLVSRVNACILNNSPMSTPRAPPLTCKFVIQWGTCLLWVYLSCTNNPPSRTRFDDGGMKRGTLRTNFPFHFVLTIVIIYRECGYVAAWLSGNIIVYWQEVSDSILECAVRFFCSRELFYISCPFPIFYDVFVEGPCIMLIGGQVRHASCVHVPVCGPE